jgi:glycosyltransferase involved in cell wall biosynthesis
MWVLVPQQLAETPTASRGVSVEPTDQSLKFSVIIPTYRRSHSLNATIATILAQTYANWELIVIDNFGDCTMIVADPRIGMHVHTDKHSASYARNQGLAYATGDLVCFFDDDDDMYPRYLERFAEAFRTRRGAKMVRCGMVVGAGRVNYSYATPEVCLRREYAEPTWAPDGPGQDQRYFRRIVARHGWSTTRGDIVIVNEPLCRANRSPSGGLRAGAY